MITCDVVIPAFNEEANIDALFDAIAPLRDGVIGHVVLGDNGSTDATAARAAARGAVVVSEPHRGYGAACLAALDWLDGRGDAADAVAFLDADLSDDPTALPDLLAPLARSEADIVIGSRVRRADPGALNFVQRFGNGLACALMRGLAGRRYRDLGPFRVVRRETLRRLAMADRTWGWTVEMQMKAALLNIDVIEVDVPYRRRRGGRSKISGTVQGVAAAGAKIIGTIFLLWWHRDAIRRAAARPQPGDE